MDLNVDNDFDGKLLDQFRSMGTTDHDVLIAEFQAVLGNKPNPDVCAFFLDMNNWNLQNAVCSYYDFEGPTPSMPSMKVLADVTVGNGESVAPSTTFYKSWRIQNSGEDKWPPGCSLKLYSGANLAVADRKMVDSLSPGQIMDVHVEMKSPSMIGSYASIWRMCSPTGTLFGDAINVVVSVAEGGLLGLTQQLSRIGGDYVPSTDTPNQQQQQQQQLLSSNNSSMPQSIVCPNNSSNSCHEQDAEMS